MRAWPLKVAAQYVGGLLTAAIFVVLLSLTFSFLGTIFCAALAGMMLGALRINLWQSLPVSLMFPLVISILLRGMKTELDGRQILIVALACFCVFWLTYVVAAALFFSERKGRSPTGGQLPVRPVCSAGAHEGSSARAPAERAAEAPNSMVVFSLEMLDGTWLPEASAQAQLQHRRMTIQKERLTLSVADSTGEVKILALARVKLCDSDPLPILLLSRPVTEPGSDTLVSI